MPAFSFSGRRSANIPKGNEIMATEAQVNANRENAKSSTGPRTEEGKAKSARNNYRFGLFATNNCVQPEEKEEYDDFCHSLWDELRPVGSVEEVTAAEFVRGAWRLRRCAKAEERLGDIAGRIQADFNKQLASPRATADPVIYEDTRPTQTAIDRARTSAQNGMRRAKADLDKLQAVRRAQPLVNAEASPALSHQEPTQAEAPLVDAEATPALSHEEPTQAEPPLVNADVTPALSHQEPTQAEPLLVNAERTQSEPPQTTQTPRNAACPCGSGLKFKRCCGTEAPAVLKNAA
jgi:hypothetical protein